MANDFEKKLWGGRFEKNTDSLVEDFHSSIHFDKRLCYQDIQGSIAHAKMLCNQGIISLEDSKKIVNGLEELLDEISSGKVKFSTSAEDIHMNIEQMLTQKIGDAGKKLHTGRSRNDQVALDTRMYVKDSIHKIRIAIRSLQTVLIDHSKVHKNSVMPGYTHLQKAQPITLSHHLMAYVEMLERDGDRFFDAYKRTDWMPLGSGALAGTTYPLDRNMVADELKFENITHNSLDAVSDRDFVLEFIFACSVTMMHLSRMCEEWILWASQEFAFIELDDGYATGSSIMPQKKNPDVAELVRGKTGRVYGDLIALLTVMKGLPLAYNKDMQEDKESLFDARDTTLQCLNAILGMVKTVTFNTDNMSLGAAGGFSNATDAADYLVAKGLPFREAHEVIGKLVNDCIKKDIALENVSLVTLKEYSSLFEEDVYEAISLETCVKNRKLQGGPAPDAVQAHIDEIYALWAKKDKLK